MQAALNIQKFSDYRAFLLAHAQDAKRRNPRWSYGGWAKRLGLNATSSLTKIIQGQRDPGPEITEKLVRYFKLSGKQAQYFRDLIALEKLKRDPRLSVLLMEKMQKDFPKGVLRTLDDHSFAVVSNWQCLAIRELVRTEGFREDPAWIAEQFRFKLTAREAQDALRRLQTVGLLKRDASGKLVAHDVSFDTTNDVVSEAIRRYHEQMLAHAKESVRTAGVEEREITSLSLSFRAEKLARAKEAIREFRNQFNDLFDEEPGNAVYQLQIQLFPLTRAKPSQEKAK